MFCCSGCPSDVKILALLKQQFLVRRWRPHFPFHFYLRRSEFWGFMSPEWVVPTFRRTLVLRQSNKTAWARIHRKLRAPLTQGHGATFQKVALSNRTLCRGCSITYVLLALFSYTVSTDVIINNGRLRNDYGCRICKGFAGSGCGLLRDTASECSGGTETWRRAARCRISRVVELESGVRTLAVRRLASFLQKRGHLSGQSNVVIPGWRKGSKGSRCTKFRSFCFEMTQLSPGGILLRKMCNSFVFLKRYTFVPPS
jgi:hypothetical protein